MKYASVKTNLLDMLAKPDFLSERINQAFFSEPLRVLQIRKGWAKIAKSDKYSGWVLVSLLNEIDRHDYNWLIKTAPARLKQNARIYSSPGQGSAEPHFLYYGNPLWIKSNKNGWSRVMSAGNNIFLRSSLIVTRSHQLRNSLTGTMLVNEARKFLGVPYLWGGLSPAGWDCSGMIQTILARFGMNIPRDTSDQNKIGDQINEPERKTGDLIFFKRHIGFAIGRYQVIHSSLGGGGVRVNSLRQNDDNFRKDLATIYLQTRRII